tara:strand:- start:58706 stop:59098 length:393 start_codon:yes stop_codon:yes gene_type:complete
MNKIYIETSVGELIDKITILEIKKSKISNKEKIVQIEKEYISLIDTTKKIDNFKMEDFKKHKDNLKKINLKLWEIEDKLRILEKEKKFDNSFIELARSVYINNDQRAKIKSLINDLSGSNIREVKDYNEY